MPDHLFDAGTLGDADPAAEAVTAQDAHAAAITELLAVVGIGGRAGGVDESAALETDRLAALAGHNGTNTLPFHLHFGNAR